MAPYSLISFKIAGTCLNQQSVFSELRDFLYGLLLAVSSNRTMQLGEGGLYVPYDQNEEDIILNESEKNKNDGIHRMQNSIEIFSSLVLL